MEQRWAVAELGWNSRECSEVELWWGSGRLWWNSGGLGHRKKLYKYLHTPAGGTQKQTVQIPILSQSRTNYKTKPITKQTQLQTVQTQNQFNNKSIQYPEGGPGKQVTTTGVGLGNISRWKLIFSQKIEFEKRGYFGTTKKKTDSKIMTQVTPGNAQVTPGSTPGNTPGNTRCPRLQCRMTLPGNSCPPSVNTNSTQNQFNTFTIITNSMQTQSVRENSIQLNPTQSITSNSIQSNLHQFNECHRWMWGMCWECMLADKDKQKQTVQIYRRNKLHKYKYKYQCQFNSMSHWKEHQSNSAESNSIVIIHGPLEVRIAHCRHWSQSANDEISRLTTGLIPLSNCKNTWTRGWVRYPQRRIKYHCTVCRRFDQNQFYTKTIQTQNQFNTNSTPIQHCSTPIQYQFETITS